MLRIRKQEPAGKPSRSFVRAARAAGMTARVARVLEPAARELFPEQPEEVLTSRTAFEQAAMHAVIGDAGNLELSFSLVDVLASAVEALGLARASDVPDPFRRVWTCNEAGARKRGVVLRCEAGEVAVFCPPSQDRFTDAGDIMKLSYRGFSSSVEYDLRLNDAVRLPGALVLHLTRPAGGGAIGRDELRLNVHLTGEVRPVGGSPSAFASCEILDVSAGGMRIACELPLEQGRQVEVQMDLPDGVDEPLRLTALVCWKRRDDSGRDTQGLQFSGLSSSAAARYEQYLWAMLPTDLDAYPKVAIGAPGPRPAGPAATGQSDTEPTEPPATREAPQVAQEAQALRAEFLERETETARLGARIRELQASLDSATQRSALQRANIGELMAALAEAQARGDAVRDALSLFPTVKRMLDDLEGTLSAEE